MCEGLVSGCWVHSPHPRQTASPPGCSEMPFTVIESVALLDSQPASILFVQNVRSSGLGCLPLGSWEKTHLSQNPFNPTPLACKAAKGVTSLIKL